MSSSPRWSMFLRAIGVKQGFRRTGAFGGMLSIAIAAGVGVISGQYIFKEPLEEYWREQKALEQQNQRQATAASASNTAPKVEN